MVHVPSGDLNGEDLVQLLLKELAPSADRQGLAETPKRVIASWKFLLQGYGQDPASVLKTFDDGAENYDEMVLQANIPLYSVCEHHMLPFFGMAYIGYLPDKKIVGLSKLSRLVDIFAQRLQVQERLTQEIASALSDNLKPLGVGVIIRCRHMCMESRGVRKLKTVTMTSKLIGAMSDHTHARQEFLNFVNMASQDAQI